MADAFRTDRHVVDELDLVQVRGELDIATAPALGAELQRVLRDGRGGVVIDLGDCGFIDSTGLAVLLNNLRRLTRAGRGLSVVAPPESDVRRVMEASRLVETLGVHDDRAAALGAARRGTPGHGAHRPGSAGAGR